MEIELCSRTVENDGSAVISTSCVFGSCKSAEPLACTLTRLSDLSDPFAPTPLSNSTVPELLVVWASFAFALPIVTARAVGAVTGGGDIC